MLIVHVEGFKEVIRLFEEWIRTFLSALTFKSMLLILLFPKCKDNFLTLLSPFLNVNQGLKIVLKSGKKWFLFASFSLSTTVHRKKKKSSKISGEEQRTKKRSSGRLLPVVPNFRRWNKGECYGLISPVVIKFPSE